MRGHDYGVAAVYFITKIIVPNLGNLYLCKGIR